MKSITLRDLPEPVEQRILQRALRDNASLNKTVIAMLSESVGVTKRSRYHDLDHLAGSASNDEADELDELIREQRIIDPELWP